MKKLYPLLLILLLSFVLISCGKESKYNVSVLDKELSGNNYNYVIEIEGDYLKPELKTIAYSTINKLYDSLKDDIKDNNVFLNVTFTYNNEDYITLKYQINKNPESPGLNLIKEIIH